MELNDDSDIPDEAADAFLLQDQALVLLERLRSEEPFLPARAENPGGGRRDFRRWPTPKGVSIALHDGTVWGSVTCLDLAVGGGRIDDLPTWVRGPVPARLIAPEVSAVIVMADVMWQAPKSQQAGLRFEFQDDEERDAWAGALIDALLAHHSLA